MAKLYVTEFREANFGSPDVSAIVDQTPVTYSTSTQSAAFNAATSLVRVHTDSICSISFGKNPTATTNTMRLAAGQTEYFAVPPGSGWKVAAITNT
jgi:hypothetical protein